MFKLVMAIVGITVVLTAILPYPTYALVAFTGGVFLLIAVRLA